MDHLYVQIVQSELRLLQGDVYVILLVCRVLQGGCSLIEATIYKIHPSGSATFQGSHTPPNMLK